MSVLYDTEQDDYTERREMIMTIDQVVDTMREELAEVPRMGVVDGIRELTEMIDRYPRELMEQRARVVADEHYLGGHSQRSIARGTGFSHNALNLWLIEFGPKYYVTVRRTDGGFVIENQVPDIHVLKQARQSGYVVAPAALRLDKVDLVPEEGGDGEWVWNLVESRLSPVAVMEARPA
jgi:hypothetical protein